MRDERRKRLRPTRQMGRRSTQALVTVTPAGAPHRTLATEHAAPFRQQKTRPGAAPRRAGAWRQGAAKLRRLLISTGPPACRAAWTGGSKRLSCRLAEAAHADPGRTSPSRPCSCSPWASWSSPSSWPRLARASRSSEAGGRRGGASRGRWPPTSARPTLGTGRRRRPRQRAPAPRGHGRAAAASGWRTPRGRRCLPGPPRAWRPRSRRWRSSSVPDSSCPKARSSSARSATP
mmetsp:Transcript_107943/g.302353  ORF Transcript_107943/g.302353 Transcript_107943/m.302353 type:complete len:233 (+) Transcript_107943:344-1042(+)